MSSLFMIIVLIIVAVFSFGFGYITADNMDLKKWIDYYEAQCIKNAEKLETLHSRGGEPDV